VANRILGLQRTGQVLDDLLLRKSRGDWPCQRLNSLLK
jgi:hypothetical protein